MISPAASGFGASLADRAKNQRLDHKHRHLDLGLVARPDDIGAAAAVI
jgi:hypothetical protein